MKTYTNADTSNKTVPLLLTDGGKVVTPTRRPPFTPQKDSWYSFLLGAKSTAGS
jgi:hypothetical protein